MSNSFLLDGVGNKGSSGGGVTVLNLHAEVFRANFEELVAQLVIGWLDGALASDLERIDGESSHSSASSAFEWGVAAGELAVVEALGLR